MPLLLPLRLPVEVNLWLLPLTASPVRPILISAPLKTMISLLPLPVPPGGPGPCTEAGGWSMQYEYSSKISSMRSLCPTFPARKAGE